MNPERIQNKSNIWNLVLLILIPFLLLARDAISQGSIDWENAYQIHINLSKEYSNLSLYAESINEISQAVEIAKNNNWEEKYIESTINLVELMRKTRDFDLGMKLLYDLDNAEKYPRLYVRMLGRMAALYHEQTFETDIHREDSIIYYLNKAIPIAQKEGFELEEASLKNELGQFIAVNKSLENGLPLLNNSAYLFEKKGDLQNYTGALSNILGCYIRMDNQPKVDSITTVLLDLVEGTNWNMTKIVIFDLISWNYYLKGDSLETLRWKLISKELVVHHVNKTNSNQMAAFRVLHKTKDYQNQANEAEGIARKKTKELALESKRSKELLLFLTLMFVLIIGVVLLLLRERKLKQEMNSINDKLNSANENYQLLMVESNHRIKNNLQMIISMIQYTSKGLDETNTQAIQSISSKVHTISSLHKHLYLDVHNERVSLKPYFEDIIKLYLEITNNEFKIESKIAQAKIKSERIVYFGLIFSELLTNTIEHNKAENKIIKLEVDFKNKSFVFMYCDYSKIESNSKPGTGITLIKQLVQRIGGKNFTYDPSIGLYQFDFDE